MCDDYFVPLTEDQLDTVFYDPDVPIDLVHLCSDVRFYLHFNQIRWAIFSKKVLGITQSRLSVLLAKTGTTSWSNLSLRVKTYYQRMREWMEKRATLGENPYKIDRADKKVGKKRRGVKAKKVPKKKNYFDMEVMRREEREEMERAEQRKAIESIMDGNVPPSMELCKESEEFLAEMNLITTSGIELHSVDAGSGVQIHGDVTSSEIHSVVDNEIIIEMQSCNNNSLEYTGGEHVVTLNNKTYQNLTSNQEQSLGAGAWSSNQISTGQDAGAWSSNQISTGQDAGAWSSNQISTSQDTGAWSSNQITTGQDTGAWSSNQITTGQDAGAWSSNQITTGQDAGAWSSNQIPTGQDAGAWSSNQITTGQAAGAWSSNQISTGQDAGAWSCNQITTCPDANNHTMANHNLMSIFGETYSNEIQVVDATVSVQDLTGAQFILQDQDGREIEEVDTNEHSDESATLRNPDYHHVQLNHQVNLLDGLQLMEFAGPHHNLVASADNHHLQHQHQESVRQEDTSSVSHDLAGIFTAHDSSFTCESLSSSQGVEQILSSSNIEYQELRNSEIVEEVGVDMISYKGGYSYGVLEPPNSFGAAAETPAKEDKVSYEVLDPPEVFELMDDGCSQINIYEPHAAGDLVA